MWHEGQRWVVAERILRHLKTTADYSIVLSRRSNQEAVWLHRPSRWKANDDLSRQLGLHRTVKDLDLKCVDQVE